MSWQTMDSAPKDGTRVLIAFDTEIRAAYWEAEFECVWNEPENVYTGAWTDDAVLSFGYEEVQSYEPTHWMPLPDPPLIRRIPGLGARGDV